VKNYKARIARLERILVSRQKAALLLFVKLAAQEQRETERQARAGWRPPPQSPPSDENSRHAQWPAPVYPSRPEGKPSSPAHMERIEEQANPEPLPDLPEISKTERRFVEKPAQIADMGAIHSNRRVVSRGWKTESDDEQRRRVPPLVF